MQRISCRLFHPVNCLWLLALGFAGCGSASPDQVYQTWASAVKTGSFPVVWECLTPQTRGTVLQIMVLDADSLSSANAAAKGAFDQAYQKYGLNPQDASFQQSRLQTPNSSALAADLDNVFRQFQNDLSKLDGSRYQKLQEIWKATAQASVAKSQLQGTRATAVVQGKIPHTTDTASVQAVFEKVNGRWFLSELEETAAGMAMAGGPAGAGPAAGGMPGAGGPAGAMPGAGGPGAMPPGGAPMQNPAGGPAGSAIPAGTPLAGGPGAADAKTPMPMPAAGAPTAPALPGGPAMAGADPKNMPAEPKAMPADPKAVAGAPKAMPGDPKAMPAEPNGKVAGAGGPAMAGKAAKPGEDAKAMPAQPGAAGAAGAAAAGGADATNPGKLQRSENPSANQQNQPKPGSFEHAIMTFAEKMSSGELVGIDYVISVKAKGELGEIRSGDVGADRLDELKSIFESPAPQMDTWKNSGTTISITLKGKKGHSIALTAGKEEGVFKIKEMKIYEPGASKKK